MVSRHVRIKYAVSCLAGIFIALGAAVFLKVGGIVGAVMFSFGLMMVIRFKTPLYTGTAGFLYLKDYKEYLYCFEVLLANVIGCFLLSLLDIGVDGTSIIQSRISSGFLHCLLASIGCGFIMTVVVKSARDEKYGIPMSILFGVPLFILLGFYHSIADAFYFFSAWNYDIDFLLDYLPFWGLTVLGNFIGCNIPNILYYDIQDS